MLLRISGCCKEIWFNLGALVFSAELLHLQAIYSSLLTRSWRFPWIFFSLLTSRSHTRNIACDQMLFGGRQYVERKFKRPSLLFFVDLVRNSMLKFFGKFYRIKMNEHWTWLLFIFSVNSPSVWRPSCFKKIFVEIWKGTILPPSIMDPIPKIKLDRTKCRKNVCYRCKRRHDCEYLFKIIYAT